MMMISLKAVTGIGEIIADGDLALHVERTRRLAAGETLSDFIDDIRRRWGIATAIVPMSDQVVETRVLTADGDIGFQQYFVGQGCAPAVKGLSFRGAQSALPSPRAVAALSAPDLDAIVIAPSNPYLSIDPILAVPGMTKALRAAAAPVIAVTPIMEGRAVKGPTAKIMTELGVPPSPVSIASHYAGIIDGFIFDRRDSALASNIGVPVQVTDTLMTSLADRERVAQAALSLAADLTGRRQ